jgi:hypothetical protein
MSQVTLYLDAETEALLAAAVSQAGVSRSSWVAELIRRHARDAWPPECVALAGQFADFPLREGSPLPAASEAADVPRLGF